MNLDTRPLRACSLPAKRTIKKLMDAFHLVLSVLFFQERPGVWVAQALERDIAAQGPSVEAARLAFERTIAGYLKLDTRLNRELLSGLEPAPTEYWEMWERVQRKELEEPLFADEPAVPPAYVIAAISTEQPTSSQ